MALTASRELERYVDQELRALPVKAGVRVYKGALVGLTGGFARGLVAGDSFAGVAYEEVDNTAGANGERLVRVFTMGDFEHALASAARASNGAAVYASDDGTLTLTASGNSLVGRQVDVPASGRVVLRLRPWMET
jgi:hypothetical protein